MLGSTHAIRRIAGRHFTHSLCPANKDRRAAMLTENLEYRKHAVKVGVSETITVY